MNSLANLNSVVDEQGDSAPWASDQSWDPPAASMICTGSLSDTRLHFHHSAPPRQEWDWSDSHMILAPHYATEDEELETKPGALHVDSMSNGLGQLGVRHYGGAGMMSAVSSMAASSSIGGNVGSTAMQTTAWPVPLNAVPLRQPGGMETTAGSFGTAQLLPVYGGGLGNAVGSNNQPGLGSYYNYANQSQILDMEQQRRIQDILKRGMYTGAGDVGGGRLGLNLGGRTYFSSEDMGARFHFAGMGKRFRPNSPSMHVPLCQAEGCKADLSIAKHYHRRHKVCEYHSKAATVVISGNTQRFCQQCSRFHALTEFDEGKRSCRKRLADHNRRRRKPQPAPAAPMGDSNAQRTLVSVENNASTQQENQSKASITNAAETQSEHQGVHQSKEAMSKLSKTSSSPDEEQATQLLSPMTLAPSVSLSLQNGGGRSEIQGSQSNNSSFRSQDRNTEEAGYINERHSLTPYLLNGPSLSLSSNNVANVRLLGMGGGDTISSSTDHQSPVDTSGPPPTIDEVELPVPWLRGQHGGSTSRGPSHLQDNLGRLSADGGSLLYKFSSARASDRRKNSRGEYINAHDQLLAENMQNLHPEFRERLAQGHHNVSKMENWMLEGAVASEGQGVLSLLETSVGTADRKKEPEDYPHQIGTTTLTANLAEHHHHHHHHQHITERHRSSRAEHPLQFIQPPYHAHQQLSSNAPSTEMDHQGSDAALSLHCMQVLRPLSESLYTTADFMKDGFV